MNAATVKGLIRVRWGARQHWRSAVLASGVANVLHAQADPVSRAISAGHRWRCCSRWSSSQGFLFTGGGWPQSDGQLLHFWPVSRPGSRTGIWRPLRRPMARPVLRRTVAADRGWAVVAASISPVELNARIRAHTDVVVGQASYVTNGTRKSREHDRDGDPMTRSATLTNTITPVEPNMPRPGSRADRMRMPIAKEVLRQVAETAGVCVRPLAIRRTDTHTGLTEIVDVPCGARLASQVQALCRTQPTATDSADPGGLASRRRAHACARAARR